MPPTIRDVLDLPVVQAAQPEVLGAAVLDHEVRWVHVSDVSEISHLLLGGELILTTGGPLADHARREQYLRDLNEAGVVGVAVELGAQLAAVPDDAAQLAEELGLCLIAFHHEIKFVEVTEAVHRIIVAEHYDELTFAHHVHEVFTDLSMRRAPLTEIVDAAAQIIDAPVVLEDLNRQVLAFAARGIPTVRLLHDWERRSRLTPISTATGIHGPESWITAQVGPHRRDWGRLVMPVLPQSVSQAQLVAERAAQALALRRMIDVEGTNLEQQAQSGLVDELVQERISDESVATARAFALGLRPARHYLPLTIRSVGAPTLADDVSAQRRQLRRLDAVRHTIRAAGQAALTANRQSGRIDVLLSEPSGTDPERALRELCSSVKAALARTDSSGRCVVGAGSPERQLIDAAIGLQDSAHIADVAAALPAADKPFYRATDVRLRGLLALIRSDPRVQAFAETELRALLEHRARHKDDMFDFLRTFLDTGGNKSELAKRLHLSRPAIYAKLATLQRILGVDLDDAESRTSLHTAILILESPRS
ncbi:MAG: PucR family transcriptional regulator [Mycobacterium sp.]